MVNEQPNIKATSRFSIAETCGLLGIHRNTLRKYTKEGRIKAGVRKSTAKPFYLGSEILNFWTRQI